MNMRRKFRLGFIIVGCSQTFVLSVALQWMLTLSSCAQTKETAASQQSVATDQLPSSNGQWWCYPLPGAKVISSYGARGRSSHSGTDLKTKPNDNILAAFDGEVVFSGSYYGYGNLVRIKHANGLETYYSHNSKNLVKVGDYVHAGDVVALTGRTGRATTEHLHFETRINGKHVNSNRFFNHDTHQLRTDAFHKTKDGYMIKSAKADKSEKVSKKAKKSKKSKTRKSRKK